MITRRIRIRDLKKNNNFIMYKSFYTVIYIDKNHVHYAPMGAKYQVEYNTIGKNSNQFIEIIDEMGVTQTSK